MRALHSADTWSAFCLRHAWTSARPWALGQSRATSAAHGPCGVGVEAACCARAAPAPRVARRKRAAGEKTGRRIEMSSWESRLLVPTLEPLGEIRRPADRVRASRRPAVYASPRPALPTEAPRSATVQIGR